MNTSVDTFASFHDLRDHRVDDWLLMSSIWPTLLTCTFYFYFVKVLGPSLMKDRQPFDLRGVMVIYNIFQTFLSAWMFSGFSMLYLSGHYNVLCEPMDYSDRPVPRAALFLGHCFYLSKILDLTDTLFFVLRKKYDHITFLHVLHHGTMPLWVWISLRFVGGGNSVVGAVLNSFAHIGMYFYYMLSAMGPEVKKNLWWKRYVTAIQIWQFVLLSLHAAQSLYFGCDFPKTTTYITLFIGLKYFSLFLNFYLRAYMGIRLVGSPLHETKVTPQTMKKSLQMVNGVGLKEQNGFHTLEKKTE